MYLKLRIRREDREKGVRYETYHVKYEEGMTFLEALQRIKEEQDPTLTFRHFCRAGICGTCTIYINGYPKLACKEQVLPYVITQREVIVEPLKNFRVIKDLAVDIDPAIRKLRDIGAWIEERKEEPRIEQERSRKIEEASDCILCFACQSYCPQTLEERYAGPLFFAKIFRFLMDPRDGKPQLRLKQAVEEGYLYHCLSCNKCNNVCPKEVQPATLIRELMIYNTEV